jgi:hypothetical protein
MATNTAPEQKEHPPLARDSRGNLVAVPDGTCALRICRKTPGRPKEILDPDNKLPVRFRLGTTVQEVADAHGPDTYRVYALDELGKVLDFVTELDLTDERRDLRNASPEPHNVAGRALFAGSTDLRCALDAIVQMMRVNGEALRSVTEAQADWVKSIASSRGFFRNGPAPLPDPSKRAANDDDDDDEDDDDEDAEPVPKGIYDVLAPIAEQLAPAVGPLVAMLTSGGTSSPAPAASKSVSTDLASRPKWEMRDFIDLRYAAAKTEARKAANQGGSSPNDLPAPTKPSLQARVMSDPKLLAHFVSIRALLQPDEQTALTALANQITEREQERLITEIKALPTADAAAFLRALLEEMRAGNETSSNNNQ